MATGTTPTLLLTAAVAGALAGFFGHDLVVGKRQDQALPVDSTAPAPPGAPTAAALQAENQQLTAELDRLRGELARRPLPGAAPATDAPEVAPSAAGAAPAAEAATFDSDQLHAVLADIDWATVGGNMHKMVPLLAQLGAAIAAGQRPDLGALADLQRLNADLIKVAEVIHKGEVPGAGINGAFTHPVVVANQYGAALQAAGVPLDGDQRAAFDRLMKVYAAKDQNLRLAAGDRELQLENLAEEVELKHAFYAEAKRLLTAEQQAAVYDPKTAGRAQLDMFSTGLVLAQFARPVAVKDAASFARQAGQTYKDRLGVSGETAARLDAVIDAWAKRYPAEYWQQKADTLEQNRMMKTERIRTALRRQLELTRTILAEVDLTPEQRRKLAEGQLILVPLPR